MDFIVYSNYQYTIQYTGAPAADQTNAGCINILPACFSGKGLYAKLKVPICTPSNINSTGIAPYANGVPIADTNTQYCLNCQRFADDNTVPDNTLYMNRIVIGFFTWSNIAC
jgi:hypothetical protein